MTKIKWCPFCGEEAELKIMPYAFGRKEYYVCCLECGASSEVYGSEEGAIEKWNKRYEAPFTGSVPAGNHRIKKLLKKCLQCNAVIDYNNIRLDERGYSYCPHCKSHRLQTFYGVVYD